MCLLTPACLPDLLHCEDDLGLEVRVAHVEAAHRVGLHVHVARTHELRHLGVCARTSTYTQAQDARSAIGASWDGWWGTEGRERERERGVAGADGLLRCQNPDVYEHMAHTHTLLTWPAFEEVHRLLPTHVQHLHPMIVLT
jgi:hypothetical protein